MRARMIKPGLFKNELLGASDAINTAVFCGLWCLADREGRLEYRPARIHVEINPYRHPSSTVQALEWLIQNAFVVRYTNDSGTFLQIVHFDRHQHPHQNEPASRIQPVEPEQVDVALEDFGAKTEVAPERSGLILDTRYLTTTTEKARPKKPSDEIPAWLDVWMAPYTKGVGIISPARLKKIVGPLRDNTDALQSWKLWCSDPALRMYAKCKPEGWAADWRSILAANEKILAAMTGGGVPIHVAPDGVAA